MNDELLIRRLEYQKGLYRGIIFGLKHLLSVGVDGNLSADDFNTISTAMDNLLNGSLPEDIANIEIVAEDLLCQTSKK